MPNIPQYIEQTVKPIENSPVTYAFTISTTSVRILPQKLERLGLLFHNPIESSSSIYVCPAFDYLGRSLPAGSNFGAGSVIIFPGGSWAIGTGAPFSFSGCGTAWNAAAIAGSSVPFSVLEWLG